MIIKSAEFVISNTNYQKCPSANLPEFAFIGRSNVGKSSLINMLLGRKSLAKTSSKPGKTQTINHFLINESWHLVDLPGYGYTKAGKSARYAWGKMIEEYLTKRSQLTCTLVLLDLRREPQPIDLNFLGWMGKHQLPIALIFTKADKLSQRQAQQSLARYKRELLSQWEELPAFFVTSAETKKGREELLNFIEAVMM